ncbi:hypothetical protein [Sulfurimonas sp.]|uniref:hypothetical protein n=1 Tax=Sulfurimonas sp. TaxID=2022749 RepID=UPI003562AF8E
MKTISILLTSIIMSIFLTGCFNKHGISAKYYSDCEEYYDMQGYYHKDCGEDDIVTYEEIGDAFKEDKDPSEGRNVW